VSFVLDTNAVSALIRADPAALDRLRALARDEVGIPQPVVAEIQYGLSRLPASKRKRALEKRWQLFAAELPRVTWTEEVSVQFGKVKALLEKRGERLDDFDLAIAAHALALDATLVTANRKHMARIPGLKIERWDER
jgi:tRNA(fMet)-specific endonuclease VapC